MMLSRPDGWQVIKNRLPEDARLAGVRVVHLPCSELHATVYLEIASSVFRDDDPEFLPEIMFKAIPNVILEAIPGARA